MAGASLPIPSSENETRQTITISQGNSPPRVVEIINQVGSQLTNTYERLKWVGFMASSGTLIILATFVLSVTPVVTLEFDSQILYVVTGFLMLLTSASIFSLQNVHAYRLECMNRDYTRKVLELSHERMT
ncbi:MAG TPA: hypothetical protein VFT74_16930, partial [Isosphaeraceae bacterium]|nr:hypothetical protein [Isosphaeraceae bacterium]